MRIERTRNAGRNMLFGMILKLYQIIIPFIMRTVILYYLGERYLGLSSLFTSILQVLNLAELGVGSAMVYSMYKPIVEDDRNMICSLMNLYKIYYRQIGLVIAVIGIIMTPFVPRLVKGDIPNDINLYILYLLNLSSTVLSYWLFAYKSALLQAHQRNDIISKVTLCTSTILYGFQFFGLIVLKNYYLYVMLLLMAQAMTNIFSAIIANKMYPEYRPNGNLPIDEKRQIHRRIKDLFTAKIGGVIVYSVDNIVISAFLGLTALAIYQNYYYVLNAVNSLIAIIFSACTAGIGNSIIVETKQKNYEDLNKFTFVISWISGWCCNCFLCLYQPFMELWVGKTYMLSFNVVISLCIYFFVFELNQLLLTYKDASGLWHKDRFRPLVTALTNLTLNILLVQVVDIYGVIFSTVLSTLLIGMPWLLQNLFTYLFDKRYLQGYVRKILLYTVITVISCTVTYSVCIMFDFGLIQTILVRFIICCFIPNIIFYCIYKNMNEYKQALLLLNNMTKGKLKKFVVVLGMR